MCMHRVCYPPDMRATRHRLVRAHLALTSLHSPCVATCLECHLAPSPPLTLSPSHLSPTQPLTFSPLAPSASYPLILSPSHPPNPPSHPSPPLSFSSSALLQVPSGQRQRCLSASHSYGRRTTTCIVRAASETSLPPPSFPPHSQALLLASLPHCFHSRPPLSLPPFSSLTGGGDVKMETTQKADMCKPALQIPLGGPRRDPPHGWSVGSVERSGYSVQNVTIGHNPILPDGDGDGKGWDGS